MLVIQSRSGLVAMGARFGGACHSVPIFRKCYRYVRENGASGWNNVA